MGVGSMAPNNRALHDSQGVPPVRRSYDEQSNCHISHIGVGCASRGDSLILKDGTTQSGEVLKYDAESGTLLFRRQQGRGTREAKEYTRDQYKAFLVGEAPLSDEKPTTGKQNRENKPITPWGKSATNSHLRIKIDKVRIGKPIILDSLGEPRQDAQEKCLMINWALPTLMNAKC